MELSWPGEARSRRRGTRTLLLVGTERERLTELARQLGDLGHLVVLSDSAAQALELIAGRGFDLVLVDLAAAHGGLHLLAEIRSARATADLPVILLGEAAASDWQVVALAAAADDCLVRPFPFDLLAARIGRVLARSGRMESLKRSNLALDARLAARAMELGEMRCELASFLARQEPVRPTIADQRAFG
jgi:DNA-binding response OmpR family regulator